MKQADIEIPVSSGNTLAIREHQVKKLSKQYPLVDVLEGLRDYIQSLKDDPTLIKSRSATPRYYKAWLAIRQRQREIRGDVSLHQT